MKLSSAAVTVAAISFLSATHASPLVFKNGEVNGRLHHRRGSDMSELSKASSATEAMEELNIGFEPGAGLVLPRIFNFFKRQISSNAATATAATPPVDTAEETYNSGTTDTDLRTAVMTPDYESYGFASEGGSDTALHPVMEVKE